MNVGRVTNFFVKHSDVSNATDMAFDIAGKGLLLPAVVAFHPTSKESKECKRYSATKNVVAAGIEVVLQVPVFYAIWNGVGKLGNKGLLDKDSGYSFNSRSFRKKFEQSLEDVAGLDTLKKELKKKKGLTKRLTYEFEEAISNINNKVVTEAFENFRKVDKRLFHLKSRFSFAGLLLTMPLVCAIENKVHPKLMELIKRKKGDDDDDD